MGVWVEGGGEMVDKWVEMAEWVDGRWQSEWVGGGWQSGWMGEWSVPEQAGSTWSVSEWVGDVCQACEEMWQCV